MKKKLSIFLIANMLTISLACLTARQAFSQTTGGGSTSCATCITETAIGLSGGTGTWADCRNSCVAMGAGWRMPTWDEEAYIGSGALGTPTGGWIANYVWTSTPWDSRVAATPTDGDWVVFDESSGYWNTNNYSNPYYCRCVR